MKIAVFTTLTDLIPAAKQLAKKLHLPFINALDKTFPFLLSLDHDGLSLIQTAKPTPGPIRVDFAKGKSAFRRRTQQKELLAKAIGITSKNKPTIIDTTAGLGIDAFVLASLGCKVIMLERSPIIAALLQDGINRAKAEPELKEIMQRIKLIQTDSINYLQNLTKKPDIIYLDPMFPERKKSALVKKEMRALQQLLDKKEDTNELFKLTLQKAKNRVIVKRPHLAPFIANQKPDFQIKGKSCRFDIYTSHKQ